MNIYLIQQIQKRKLIGQVLFADGNVSKRDNCFEMSLAEKDKEHLEKFNNFINHSRNIA